MCALFRQPHGDRASDSAFAATSGNNRNSVLKFHFSQLLLDSQGNASIAVRRYVSRKRFEIGNERDH